MTRRPLAAMRSLLFLPASNPRAIAKARTLDCDLVVLDLEDAVAEADKEAARQLAADAVAEGFAAPCAVRINAAASAWHAPDLAAFPAAADYLVLPMAETPAQVAEAGRASGKPVIAMIETARGVLEAPAIARVSAALLMGTNDLRADLGLGFGHDRSALMTALQTVVLAARAARIPAFDGVFNALDDPAGLAREAAEGRALGFSGKSAIHPGQLAAIAAAWQPSPEEIARAERLVAAAGSGARRWDGQMIEDLHVAAARALLERARQREPGA